MSNVFRNKICAVIFNLDGVILDSVPLWKDAFNNFFRKRNLIMPQWFLEYGLNYSLKDVAKYLSQNFAPDENEKDIYKEIKSFVENKYAKKVKLKDGVKELLEYLSSLNIYMYFVTMTEKDIFEPCLKRLGLKYYFGGEWTDNKDAENGKTDGEVYDSILERTTFELGSVLVFENSPNSVKNAIENGYQTIGVFDANLSTNPTYFDEKPMFFYKDISGFINVLEEDYLSYRNGFTFVPYYKGYQILSYDYLDKKTLVIPRTHKGKNVNSIAKDCFTNGEFKHIDFSPNLKEIGSCSFDNCKELEEIILPPNLRSVGLYAFSCCTKVRSLTFTGGVKTIFSSFEGLDSLTEINFHPKQKHFGFRAFWLLKGLKELHLVEGLETIDMQSFNGCTNLEVVYLPKSVKSIRDDAFYRCPSLKKVVYAGSKQDREKITIYNEEHGNDDLLNAEWEYLGK